MTDGREAAWAHWFALGTPASRGRYRRDRVEWSTLSLAIFIERCQSEMYACLLGTAARYTLP